MTGRTLIEKVLTGAKKPLSVSDIWNIAKEKKYAKSYGSGTDEQKKRQIGADLIRWYNEKDSTLGRYEKGEKGNKYITYFLRKEPTPDKPNGNKKYPNDSEDKISPGKITITPKLFKIPEKPIRKDCISVMMPFKKEFDDVYEAIKNACSNVNMSCHRADDIWENSTIIQDIFELIYRSNIVIVDFSDKNPNVFYESGIAHTLGKDVIPITQHLNDIPYDLQHHRSLTYLSNGEGLKKLSKGLEERLKILKNK